MRGTAATIPARAASRANGKKAVTLALALALRDALLGGRTRAGRAHARYRPVSGAGGTLRDCAGGCGPICSFRFTPMPRNRRRRPGRRSIRCQTGDRVQWPIRWPGARERGGYRQRRRVDQRPVRCGDRDSGHSLAAPRCASDRSALPRSCCARARNRCTFTLTRTGRRRLSC